MPNKPPSKPAGAERVYSEKISGAVTDRKALAKALAALQEGDVLVVTRLDRLARSTHDLLNILRRSPTRKRDSDRSATRGPTPPPRTAA